jgi:uncharacterized protein (TIGR02231 family)
MLKRLLMVTLTVFVVAAAQAEDSQKVNSKIQKVIVFLQGGQVTRTASTTIKPGTSTLVFDNISPDMDAQSIQVTGNGDFTILSVKQQQNFLDDQTKQKNVEELQNRQQNIREKITQLQDMMLVYQEEEKLLLKNQLISGPNNNIDLAKLKLALDFQTARLTELKKNQQSVIRQVNALNVELSKYNNQIADAGRAEGKGTSSIVVTVAAANSTPAQFTLSYVIGNANWSPAYDIRAKNVNSPITIVYKANVTQQSGEDWKDVKLTLSTGNPYVSANKPDLSPYYLDIERPRPQADMSSQLNEVVVVGYGNRKKENSLRSALAGKVAGLQVTQVENQTNVEFSISNPFSVGSDGKPAMVEMNQVSLPAKYEYYVAPKVSTNVFLTAHVTGWNQYNFLPGDVNLFFEGTYIGKSRMESQMESDTLNLSLGIDKNIVVSRTLQKSLTEKQGIVSNKKQTRDWVIEIKNRKNQAINLLVEDQVPVSQNSTIKVETKELSGGKFDPLTGLVAWNFALKPLDDKKTLLSYQVNYPKNQQLAVQ